MPTREECVEEKQSMKDFWEMNGKNYREERSVKKIFAEYKQFCQEKGVRMINEYVFREWIRRHGYVNGQPRKKKEEKE